LKVFLATIFLLLGLSLYGQIQLLNDEFSDSASIVNWLNINDEEGWNITQLETYDINVSTPGNLFIRPFTESWFGEYRGAYIFKYISGNFVFSTNVLATGLDGVSLPSSDFSLAGIMVRHPVDYPNKDPINQWMPAQQNYIFMSIGQATGAGFDFEIKNTCNSVSCLDIVSIDTSTAEIRMARRGDQVIVLSRLPGEGWEVRNRYNRIGIQCGSIMNNCNAPFPDTLQIGFVVYTDWPKVSSYSFEFHNTHTLHPDSLGVPDPSPGVPFNPDIIADFEYARFDSLFIPDSLETADLSDPNQVSDQTILQLLGYDSQVFCPPNLILSDPSPGPYQQVQVQESIISTQNLGPGMQVFYHAGIEVSLQPGFEVKPGASFTIQLVGCDL